MEPRDNPNGEDQPLPTYEDMVAALPEPAQEGPVEGAVAVNDAEPVDGAGGDVVEDNGGEEAENDRGESENRTFD